MRAVPKSLIIILVLLFAVPAAAQDASTVSSPTNIPEEVRIDGLTLVHQDTNRCSAAALSIQLSHFDGVEMTYSDVVRRLNPYGGDVSVRIEEMAEVARE